MLGFFAEIEEIYRPVIAHHSGPDFAFCSLALQARVIVVVIFIHIFFKILKPLPRRFCFQTTGGYLIMFSTDACLFLFRLW